jgi:hypothetical protein
MEFTYADLQDKIDYTGDYNADLLKVLAYLDPNKSSSYKNWALVPENKANRLVRQLRNPAGTFCHMCLKKASKGIEHLGKHYHDSCLEKSGMQRCDTCSKFYDCACTKARREINMRYNAKHADKINENAIAFYNANKERISARRREIYAEKKQQAIIESAERQRRCEEMGPNIKVLSQFINDEGIPMEIVWVPIIQTTMLRPQSAEGL